MSSKLKGIYKSFKYVTQIFGNFFFSSFNFFLIKLSLNSKVYTIAAMKDREMEIGYPTDVKHVSHIGLDNSSPSGPAPSWVYALLPLQSK